MVVIATARVAMHAPVAIAVLLLLPCFGVVVVVEVEMVEFGLVQSVALGPHVDVPPVASL